MKALEILFLFCILGDCLRLLLSNNSNYNESFILSIVDAHVARFNVLSNRTASLNKYISGQIAIMTPQILGIVYFKNESYQDCLNIFNDATQFESSLVIDNNSPILIFSWAAELLAMHLLLIHRLYSNPPVNLI